MQDFEKRVEEAINIVTKESLEKALKNLPELDAVPIYNTGKQYTSVQLKAVVWNIERGAKTNEILAYLKSHHILREANLILANELDDGMKRSGNKNISKVLAKELDMNYVYGIEYISLDKDRNENTKGFHGNTIFSKYKILRAKVIRLPIAFEWFFTKQKRIGTRNALFSVIDFNGTEVGVVSIHLENRTRPQKRAEQVNYVLNQAKDYFSDMPVLFGGDLNTNCTDCTEEDSKSGIKDLIADRNKQLDNIKNTTVIETLFQEVEKYGYEYKTCNILTKSTRRKSVKGNPPINMNLDWFFQRGFVCRNPQLIRAIFRMEELILHPKQYESYEGTEMSDHDAIAIDCVLNK